jgi:hypothetical protein
MWFRPMISHALRCPIFKFRCAYIHDKSRQKTLVLVWALKSFTTKKRHFLCFIGVLSKVFDRDKSQCGYLIEKMSENRT